MIFSRTYKKGDLAVWELVQGGVLVEVQSAQLRLGRIRVYTLCTLQPHRPEYARAVGPWDIKESKLRPATKPEAAQAMLVGGARKE